MNPPNTPTPETKSPVRLTLAIIAIILTLSIGGYLARESLLEGMLGIGLRANSPGITAFAANGLVIAGGKNIWWRLRDSNYSAVARFAKDITFIKFPGLLQFHAPDNAPEKILIVIVPTALPGVTLSLNVDKYGQQD